MLQAWEWGEGGRRGPLPYTPSKTAKDRYSILVANLDIRGVVYVSEQNLESSLMPERV